MRKPISILITALLLLVATASFAADNAGTTTPSGVVNINTADATQLSYLPRVGLKAAQKIVEYRTQHGSFKKPTDLMQVKGFGEKRYEKLSAYLTVDGHTTLSAKVASPRKARSRTAKRAASPANTAR